MEKGTPCSLSGAGKTATQPRLEVNESSIFGDGCSFSRIISQDSSEISGAD